MVPVSVVIRRRAELFGYPAAAIRHNTIEHTADRQNNTFESYWLLK
jgi:hypothetical protein